MPRPLRIEYEGAIYHVMACGQVKALNRERVKRGDPIGRVLHQDGLAGPCPVPDG